MKYEVTEEQMMLIVSIINEVIERSPGCPDEWTVDTSGMFYDEEGFGFVEGDSLIYNPEEVTDSLKWVLFDCFTRRKK